jgi:hypothetical protein
MFIRTHACCPNLMFVRCDIVASDASLPQCCNMCRLLPHVAPLPRLQACGLCAHSGCSASSLLWWHSEARCAAHTDLAVSACVRSSPRGRQPCYRAALHRRCRSSTRAQRCRPRRWCSSGPGPPAVAPPPAAEQRRPGADPRRGGEAAPCAPPRCMRRTGPLPPGTLRCSLLMHAAPRRGPCQHHCSPRPAADCAADTVQGWQAHRRCS